MATTTRKTVHVGVFIPTEAQLLDMACVDIIGSMSYGYMSLVSTMIPASVLALCPNVRFYYISAVQPGQPIPLTAETSIPCTHHYTSPEVAPGKLDIVLVPGPDPFSTNLELDEGKVAAWLAAQGGCQTTDVLSVCTGIMWCGAAGLLKGRSVCGPRGLTAEIRKHGFGERELIGEKVRWWQDGNFWSSGESFWLSLSLLELLDFCCKATLSISDLAFVSVEFESKKTTTDDKTGGITNGNDLVAAYCRQSRHFPRPLVEITCEMVDVGDRSQYYEKSQAGFVLTMVLNTFRAWLTGFGRGKGKSA